MTIVERLRKERDEYREAYLNYRELYNRLIDLCAEQQIEIQSIRGKQEPKQPLVVQFKKRTV